jgi:hypothetical protein
MAISNLSVKAGTGSETAMRQLHRCEVRLGVAFLVLFLVADAGAALAQQSGATDQPDKATASEKLPDSPGAVRFQITASNRQNEAGVAEEAPSANPPAEKQPVGTAAAEGIRTSGVAASAPAGTAIAPAKQRQVRSLLIKMGAVLGAGAAVGTVYALSAATPSKPPGAH